MSTYAHNVKSSYAERAGHCVIALHTCWVSARSEAALWLDSSAAGIVGFALAACACQLRIGDSDVVLSTLATAVLPPGTARCSSASADAGGEIVARILSANKSDCADFELAVGCWLFCDGQLDFSRPLNDLH